MSKLTPGKMIDEMLRVSKLKPGVWYTVTTSVFLVDGVISFGDSSVRRSVVAESELAEEARLQIEIGDPQE